MYEKLLEGSGLSKNESLIYLALLRIGKAKSSQIVNAAKISSGRIYETLEKLTAKGLVKMVSENGVKHFMASKPESLIQYVEEREKDLHEKKEELAKIIPELNSITPHTDLDNVSLIKGIRGIEPIFYEVALHAKEVKIMGVRSGKNLRYNTWWKKLWKNWSIERKHKKAPLKILFSDTNTDYWDHYKKEKYAEVRLNDTLSPSAVMILGDNVFMFTYEEVMSCVHIVSKPISLSFSGFFDSIWNVSK